MTITDWEIVRIPTCPAVLYVDDETNALIKQDLLNLNPPLFILKKPLEHTEKHVTIQNRKLNTINQDNILESLTEFQIICE